MFCLNFRSPTLFKLKIMDLKLYVILFLFFESDPFSSCILSTFVTLIMLCSINFSATDSEATDIIRFDI